MTIEEAMETLAAVDLRVGVVIARATSSTPPQIVLRQIPVAGEEITEDSGVSIEVSVPEDPDRFMTLAATPICNSVVTDNCIDNSVESAAAYYDAIDPDDEKTTYADWLSANGFGSRGGGIEANAIYFNEFDLGFGRNMRMRFNSPDHIAYVVTNHASVDQAFVDSDSPINTVAMEYSVTPANGAEPFIKFFTFDENGNRIEAVDLDGRDEKFQPIMCMSCHGGPPSGFDLDNYPGNGDLGVPGFIPFDLDSFIYSEEFDEISRRNQESLFSQLNAGVLSSWQSIGAREIVRWDTLAVPIPDGDARGVALEMEVKDPLATIRDVNLSIQGSTSNQEGVFLAGLSHTDVASLEIRLTSPRGTTAVLFDGALGGTAGDMQFDDEAEVSLSEMSRLGQTLTGIVIPAEPLSVFDGESASGNWYLTVIDHEQGITGQIDQWTLDLRLQRGALSPAEELIQGWYGAPTGTTPEGLPIFANNFDGTFIPGSWTDSAQSVELYDRVMERSCRTCHVMQEDRRATFGTFAEFEAFKLSGTLENRVFVQGTMPDALRTYHNFWTGLAVVDNERVPVVPTGPEVLAEYLDRPLSGPGLPLADAGTEFVLDLASSPVTAQLDGSGSLFADTYAWSWDTGSVATPTIQASDSAFASFVPTVPGEYRLRLIVFKGATPSEPDGLLVTVRNPAPTAVASIVGPSSIQPGVLQATVDVQLDGSGSSDPDGSVVEYIWTVDATVNPASPDPDDVAMPTVTLPANSQHRFLLQVRDNFGALSTVSQQPVSVSDPLNGPPVANAGTDQLLALDLGQESDSIQFDGTASGDPENQALVYVWEPISPAGAPNPDDVAQPSVVLPRTALTDTLYTYRLTVFDDDNASSFDLVSITVRRAGPSFNNEVSGMLGSACSACHAGGYTFDATLSATGMFATLSGSVNTTTPESSAVLLKPSSTTGPANCTGITHLGGVQSGFDWCAFETGGGTLNDLLTTPIANLPVGVQRYATILRWITDGAECTDCP